MRSDSPLIVLVDDDPDFQEIGRRALESGGYRVLCFSDAESALDHAAHEKPSLVITDLMMRTLDAGFSLARRLKDDPRLGDVPVIIVTAIASQLGLDLRPQTFDDLETMGADAFLEKPVSVRALCAQVEALLAGRTAEDKR